jgi:hypothetical protein
MAQARELSFHDLATPADITIVSPNDPEAMAKYPAECKALGIPYIYDPSQQIVRMSGDVLRAGVEGANMLIVNDYEYELLKDATGMSEADIRAAVTRAVIVTQGENGSLIWAEGEEITVPVVPPKQVLDPTGVGDALRSFVDNGGSVVATTYALSDPWSLEGGITQPGYLPFQIGTPGYVPTLPITATLPGDPIFNGIDLNTLSFFINFNYINPVLDPGAILLATDQLGAPMIARNTASTVYAINAWPGIGGSGDFFPLLANISVSAANTLQTWVPEPDGLMLLSLGLAGLSLVRRRRCGPKAHSAAS